MNARGNLCYDSLPYPMYLIRCPVNEIFGTIGHFDVELQNGTITQRKATVTVKEIM
jgi:hypothetical protein